PAGNLHHAGGLSASSRIVRWPGRPIATSHTGAGARKPDRDNAGTAETFGPGTSTKFQYKRVISPPARRLHKPYIDHVQKEQLNDYTGRKSRHRNGSRQRHWPGNCARPGNARRTGNIV